MKRFVSPVVALVLGLVTVSASAQDWLSLADAVVLVECGRGVGTGTLVARYEQDGQQGGYVLTAKHVVEESPRCYVTWRSGYRADGYVDARGQLYDTALIRVRPPTDSPIIPVADKDAPSGVTAHVFGYGGQYNRPIRTLQLLHGEIKVRGYATYADSMAIICDPWCMSGDSGGPIVHSGHVVGVISGYSSPRDTRGPHCTPIRNLLRSVLPHGIVAGIDRRRAQAACPGGTCPLPGRSAPGILPRQPVPRTPVQKPPAVDTIPAPPSQPPMTIPLPAASDCSRSAEIDALLAAQRRLDAELAAVAARIGSTVGPAGPAGSKGDAGPVGPRGEAGSPGQPGADGKDALVDMAALAEAVQKALPPVRVQLLDETGKVTQEQAQPLGQPIRLQLVPVKKQSAGGIPPLPFQIPKSKE